MSLLDKSSPSRLKKTCIMQSKCRNLNGSECVKQTKIIHKRCRIPVDDKPQTLFWQQFMTSITREPIACGISVYTIKVIFRYCSRVIDVKAIYKLFVGCHSPLL